ncbi:MAG: hypothetical protein ACFFFK_02920 [Candidatus Thorarchaeota archaeon]
MIAQITPTMFMTISVLSMFMMMSGLTLFLFLEMGVMNIGKQKRLVHIFMKHPWKIEALIISMFLSLPISIASISYIAGDYSLSFVVIVWPVLIFVQHSRFMDFQQTLGIGKKKEYDPILIAKLNVAVWFIAVCGIVIGFLLSLYDISQDLSQLIVIPCMMVMFLVPFRKSLALVRNQSTEIEGEFE